MIIGNVVIASTTLAGTVLLAKLQGYYEPDKKKNNSKKNSK